MNTTARVKVDLALRIPFEFWRQVRTAGSTIYGTGFQASGWARLPRRPPDDQSGILSL